MKKKSTCVSHIYINLQLDKIRNSTRVHVNVVKIA